MKEPENGVAEIGVSIWKAIDLLRGKIDDLYFFLYLLFLHKEGVFKNIDREDLLIYNDHRKALGILFDRNPTLREVNEIFTPSFNQVDKSSLYQIIRILHLSDQSGFNEKFSLIFDYLLFKISQSEGRKGGEKVHPHSLTSFICSLIDISPIARIYNPFAGLASLPILLDRKNDYRGQEINAKSWAVGYLRLLVHGFENTTYIHDDSIDHWNPFYRDDSIQIKNLITHSFEKEKYDLIVSSPPLNYKLSVTGKFGQIPNAEHFLIEKGIDDLKVKGKLIAVVSQGFLFRLGGEWELRKHLVENDLLEEVISLPAGILHNTNIPVTVIVINKDKKRKGFVRFIDGKDFVTVTDRERTFNDKALINLVRSEEGSTLVRLVDNTSIASSDFNFSVLRYFQIPQQDDEDLNTKQLKDYVNILRGEKGIEGTLGKSLSIKDLKDHQVDFRLDTNKVQLSNVGRYSEVISESCLLLALRGGKLKPTYFKYEGESIYVSPEILVLHIDESRIYVEYLIHELKGEFVKEQFTKLQIGTSILSIKREDILRLSIKVPTFAEQKAKVQGINEAYILNRENELKLEKELFGLKDRVNRQSSSLKHSIRQYLNNLKSNVSGTIKFFSKHEGENITLNTVYSQNQKSTLRDHFLSAERTVNSITQLLSALDEEESFSSKAKLHRLTVLILEAQNRFANSEVFIFDPLYIDEKSFEDENGVLVPYVEIDEENFYRIFSNIVSNAVDHGFKNSKKTNIIRTSLAYLADKGCCSLEVSNNGRPIPRDFTYDDLITRGEKTIDSNGTGIGGSDIKEILDLYPGASFDVSNQEESEYPVTYIIYLPLKNFNEDEI